MGKQQGPKKRVKLDKGPDNLRMLIKKHTGKQRFNVKKGMRTMNKVHQGGKEKAQKSVGFSYRTDLAGKRITPNVTGGASG
jgi:hypothetical protein